MIYTWVCCDECTAFVRLEGGHTEAECYSASGMTPKAEGGCVCDGCASAPDTLRAPPMQDSETVIGLAPPAVAALRRAQR